MGRRNKTAIISKLNGKLNIPVRNNNQSAQTSLQSSIQSSFHTSRQSLRENSPSPVFKEKGIQTDKYINYSNIIKFVLAALIVFYEYQNLIVDTIIQLARESALKYSNNLNDNTIISIDGAWDHRRHGSTCIVTMIDINSRKIIDFSINSIPKQFVKGTTKEPSRNLEKVGVFQIAELNMYMIMMVYQEILYLNLVGKSLKP